jgi:Domain of unknown function (DUF4375)
MNKNSILISLSESEKTKVGKQDFARQSLPQKVIVAIWAIESEVNNGGFSQYFLNSSGESAPFVVEALELWAPLHFPSGLLRSAAIEKLLSGLG